ncbi:uncharacterized protein L969DRAFT_604221 [Mixia osmundae IAM 14324]|uniref:RAVE complex protein Rav1 C-terminal domain-containing protein n=1 Tax=Mixia osmundae (strain CBS 9802 / IAM 14324 / JCM 22182 / KY 12970) TaxID=764103 RepID=G7DSQ5_MIXOS|nr:uncharacterized protein L969DRAFT_604221 [Mixia osmundae IAM 14324]KEI41796.1 hypothetical protein L969DRAFT_604221 [Mixia osmundae IAM 14324]GAA93613.1 hypothetical protein E5Q_00257 [Mixia osmundae IAM 14324]
MNSSVELKRQYASLGRPNAGSQAFATGLISGGNHRIIAIASGRTVDICNERMQLQYSLHLDDACYGSTSSSASREIAALAFANSGQLAIAAGTQIVIWSAPNELNSGRSPRLKLHSSLSLRSDVLSLDWRDVSLLVLSDKLSIWQPTSVSGITAWQKTREFAPRACVEHDLSAARISPCGIYVAAACSHLPLVRIFNIASFGPATESKQAPVDLWHALPIRQIRWAASGISSVLWTVDSHGGTQRFTSRGGGWQSDGLVLVERPPDKTRQKVVWAGLTDDADPALLTLLDDCNMGVTVRDDDWRSSTSWQRPFGIDIKLHDMSTHTVAFETQSSPYCPGAPSFTLISSDRHGRITFIDAASPSFERPMRLRELQFAPRGLVERMTAAADGLSIACTTSLAQILHFRVNMLHGSPTSLATIARTHQGQCSLVKEFHALSGRRGVLAAQADALQLYMPSENTLRLCASVRLASTSDMIFLASVVEGQHIKGVVLLLSGIQQTFEFNMSAGTATIRTIGTVHPRGWLPLEIAEPLVSQARAAPEIVFGAVEEDGSCSLACSARMSSIVPDSLPCSTLISRFSASLVAYSSSAKNDTIVRIQRAHGSSRTCVHRLLLSAEDLTALYWLRSLQDHPILVLHTSSGLKLYAEPRNSQHDSTGWTQVAHFRAFNQDCTTLPVQGGVVALERGRLSIYCGDARLEGLVRACYAPRRLDDPIYLSWSIRAGKLAPILGLVDHEQSYADNLFDHVDEFLQGEAYQYTEAECKLPPFDTARISTRFGSFANLVQVLSAQHQSLDRSGEMALISIQEALHAGTSVNYVTILWAQSSRRQAVLLTHILQACAGKLTWSLARRLGLFMWLQDPKDYATQLESIARTEFVNLDERDPISASLFYLATHNFKAVQTVWKTSGAHTERSTMMRLLANDFKQPRWQIAAKKNAYALLGKKRYLFAAAFFLLGDSLQDAVNVCARQLNDTQLAFAICRAYEGQTSHVQLGLAKSHLLPGAISMRDPAMAAYAHTCFGETNGIQKALEMEIWQDCSLDPQLTWLYLRYRRLAGMPSVPIEYQLVQRSIATFVAMGCHLLALDMAVHWPFVRKSTMAPRSVDQRPAIKSPHSDTELPAALAAQSKPAVQAPRKVVQAVPDFDIGAFAF